MKTILLNPGPVSLSEGVRRAAVAQDLCHREPEFFELQQAVTGRLAGCVRLRPRTMALRELWAVPAPRRWKP